MFENQFLYFPEREYSEHPKELGWTYEDVWLTTSDNVRVHAWWIGDSSHRRTVLFFHGNAGNISHRLDRLRTLGQLPLRYFFLDYRGYGQSEGKPSEKGLYKDADAAYQYLRTTGGLADDQIILFGSSLGGAVAADLASREPTGRVVLENSFTSLRDIAGAAMPFIPRPFVPNTFLSVEKIRKIQVPLLIMHSEQDEIIPFRMGRELFDAASTEKEFYAIPRAHHNDSYVIGGQAYFNVLGAFLLGKKPVPSP